MAKFQQLSIPFLHIRYTKKMDFMYINNELYDVKKAAVHISKLFNVPLNPGINMNMTKQVNDKMKVTDPFHTWSRKYFHGTLLKKQDLDLVLISKSNPSNIGCIFEVKRSDQRKVGDWAPFAADTNNYLQLMYLSNTLNIPFVTIHHESSNNNVVITDTTKVDVFYHAPNQQINFSPFSNVKNRRVVDSIEIKNFIHSL
ncbi:hypothetical protein ACFU6E_26085 [Bacillus cereus]|uniref:hypothetical protein n=1 Tax=Bacillus cereus TaxID=1396 RepID=UPI00366CDA1E